MPNWTNPLDEDFYIGIKRDFEGAKINEGNMATILRRHRLFIGETQNGTAPSDDEFIVLTDLMELLHDKGWKPAECGALEFLRTRFAELESLRKAAGNPGGLDAANEIRGVFYQRIGELFSSSDATDQKIAGELVSWFKTTRWA